MNYEITLQVERAIADLKDQLGENESQALPDREIMKAIQALTNGKTNYLSACEEVTYYDKETQDYLHGIELFNLGEDEAAALLAELKEIRNTLQKMRNTFTAINAIRRYLLSQQH